MEKTTIGNVVPFSTLFQFGLSILVFSSLAGCNQPGSDLPRPEIRDVSINYAPLGQMPAPRIETRPRNTANVPASWIPSSRAEERNRWRGIIVHHSATSTGSAATLNALHKKRKDRNGESWLGLGYHFVISNGRGGTDGKVEVGFRWPKQMTGAHCRPRSSAHNYWNEHTIGICLVGNFEQSRPTAAQYNSLAKLIRFLKERYPIPANAIQGHGDIAGAATACPGRNFSWWTLRQRLGGTIVATK